MPNDRFVFCKPNYDLFLLLNNGNNGEKKNLCIEMEDVNYSSSVHLRYQID